MTAPATAALIDDLTRALRRRRSGRTWAARLRADGAARAALADLDAAHTPEAARDAFAMAERLAARKLTTGRRLGADR